MRYATRVDFTGQPIYVGLDVHKKSWAVSIYTEHCEHKTFTQPPETEVLVSYLRRHFPGASYQAVYEAGYSGFWVHDRLQAQGVRCLVVNPGDVPTKHKERTTKTDRVDCRKLARGLRSGELAGIYVPSRGKLEDRNLLRTRHGMVRKQTRCKNQIKSILRFYGIDVPEREYWSKRFLAWLDTVRMERATGDTALRAHLEELSHLRRIIGELNVAVRSLSRAEAYGANVQLLKTIPGISTLGAMTLLTELCDIGRFKDLDHLASFVGLIPKVEASGETEHQGPITRRRNRVLRWILIEATWVAVAKDPALLMSFDRLSRRMRKTKAIVHMARKLLSRIRYVLKNQTPYVPMTV